MKYAAIVILTLLAACSGTGKKDYDAMARCNELGLQAGTQPYDQCVKDEKASRMLKEQREEFDRMKQDEQDWKMRRY